MEIKLVRDTFTKKSTTGIIYVDDELVCYSLEDPDRDLENYPERKIKGDTAIPAGRYQVTITYSPKYKRDLPLLLNVPNYEGIRIHSGNKPEDTEGCILPGNSRTVDWVSDSRNAFNELNSMIKDALDHKEKVFIEIVKENYTYLF